MDKVISASFFVSRPVGPAQGVAPNPINRSQAPPTESFRAVLEREVEQGRELRFSGHARERMAARNVNLNSAELGKINRAVDAVSVKGGRNTLVVGGSYALIVNVPNRTVITAMTRDGMQENVVTNIDSTIFVD